MGFTVSRKAEISDIVIKSDNIRQLHAYLLKQFSGAMAEEGAGTKEKRARRHNTSLRITFHQVPSTRIELSGDHAIHEDMFNLAKTERIQLEYSSFIHNQGVEKIDISLIEGNWIGESSNSIYVSGPSREWVEATYAAVQQICKSFTPQKTIHLYGHRKTLVLSAMALFLGYYIVRFIAYFSDPAPSPSAGPDPKWLLFIQEYVVARYFFFAAIFYMVGVLPASFLLDWLYKICPRIEFDFGPEHLRTHKNMRLKLTVAFSVVGGPLIYDVLKYFVGWN